MFEFLRSGGKPFLGGITFGGVGNIIASYNFKLFIIKRS